MADLTARTVLITGASGGLGSAVVDASLASGATVFGVSRSPEYRAGIDRYHALAADLADPQGARNAVSQMLETTGRLDVLVHVMGGFALGSTVETSDETWRRMMTLNLDAAFYAFRAALPAMAENNWGRVIAVGSRSGLESPAGMSAYAASKAGLNALVQATAKELRGQGITVNAVLPSIIDTPANREAMPDADFSDWVTPEAIAGQILWLASEQAQDVSGALLPIYGRA